MLSLLVKLGVAIWSLFFLRNNKTSFGTRSFRMMQVITGSAKMIIVQLTPGQMVSQVTLIIFRILVIAHVLVIIIVLQ